MRPQRIEPGAGQESVWDYPRPPRVETTSRRITVEHAGVVLADTTSALRVLETSQPPAYYLPPADVALHLLVPSVSTTTCEWKGSASYLTLQLPDAVVADVAWTYPAPRAGFEDIAGFVAFYAQKVDRCCVDGEVVQANEGSFYGGWITAEVVGPFKGGYGTLHW